MTFTNKVTCPRLHAMIVNDVYIPWPYVHKVLKHVRQCLEINIAYYLGIIHI